MHKCHSFLGFYYINNTWDVTFKRMCWCWCCVKYFSSFWDTIQCAVLMLKRRWRWWGNERRSLLEVFLSQGHMMTQQWCVFVVASTSPSSGPPQYSTLFGNRLSSSSTPARYIPTGINCLLLSNKRIKQTFSYNGFLDLNLVSFQAPQVCQRSLQPLRHLQVSK